MAVAVMILSVILMYFMAYTAAVQRTIRALGLLHPGESEGAKGADFQRVIIVLGIYLRRLNVAFLLGIGVYVIASRTSAWYYGAALIVLCWIGSLLIGSTAWLRPASAQMIAVLVADLERRREWYRSARDTVRLQVVEELLLRIRAMPKCRLRVG